MSATATAKVALPASQPSIRKGTGWPPSGTVFSALSGLQGSSRLKAVLSGRTSRQLKVGLQAASANKTAASKASRGAVTGKNN